MSEITYDCYVGMDVSKAVLDVFVSALEKTFQFPNNAKGIKQLINQLKTFSNPVIIMEATGGHEQLAAHALLKKNYKKSIKN